MSDERKYVAEEPPVSPDELSAYLSRELRRIEAAIELISQRHDLQFVDATADASAAEIIICDASATAVVVNLPGASSALGMYYSITKAKGANNVVIRSTETINGSGSATLSAIYQSAAVYSNGSEWFMGGDLSRLESRYADTAGVLASFDNTLITSGGTTAITIQAPDYDTDGFYTSTQSTRFTMPFNALVRLQAQVMWATNGSSTGSLRAAGIYKNGSNYNGFAYTTTVIAHGDQIIRQPLISAAVTASAGDYFEVFASHNVTGANITADGANAAWVSLEVVKRL